MGIGTHLLVGKQNIPWIINCSSRVMQINLCDRNYNKRSHISHLKQHLKLWWNLWRNLDNRLVVWIWGLHSRVDMSCCWRGRDTTPGLVFSCSWSTWSTCSPWIEVAAIVACVHHRHLVERVKQVNMVEQYLGDRMVDEREGLIEWQIRTGDYLISNTPWIKSLKNITLFAWGHVEYTKHWCF